MGIERDFRVDERADDEQPAVDAGGMANVGVRRTAEKLRFRSPHREVAADAHTSSMRTSAVRAAARESDRATNYRLHAAGWAACEAGARA